MNPSNFYGSTVNEDSSEFLDELKKVLYDMGVSLSVKAEFASYKLIDVAQTWYLQWTDNRTFRVGPVTWEIFKETFPRWFFPREMREENVT